MISHGQEALDGFHEAAMRRARNELERIEDEARRDSELLAGETYATAGRLFDLPSPIPRASDRTPEPGAFDFEIRDVRCSLEDLTDFVVLHSPRSMARRLLTRRAKESARDWLDRSGGRIRHVLLRKGEQFLGRVLARADEVQTKLATDMLAAIEEGASASGASERRILIDRLSAAMSKLEAA